MTYITKVDINKLGTVTVIAGAVTVPNNYCFVVMPLRDWSPVPSEKEAGH